MCAIAGIVSLDARRVPPREAVARMVAAQAHRGPDDEGIAGEGPVLLGHRRLSIQDLSQAAHQPMRHPAGHWLAYNGEIYNHQALRGGIDFEFTSSGDSETLLAALGARGEEALAQLNGMFAFAFWNKKERSLLLVRDRLGVKPLYYAQTEKYLVFASELQAVLASGLVPYELDPQAVSDYLGLRYVPAPLTAVRGVFKLAPGHLLTLRKGRVETRAWWRLPVAGMEARAPKDAQARFEQLFADAVDKRLLADVPVGVFLSGGLDSSAVAAVVAARRPVRSFSVAFESGGFYDERFYAREVAKRLGTEHAELVVTAAQFRDALPGVLGRLDEPITDLAALPLHFLAARAREDVKVVLSGEGSDEVLGGYNFNRIAFKLRALAAFQRIPRGLRDGVRSVAGARLRERLTQLGWPVDRYPALTGMHITRIFDDAGRAAVLGDWGRGVAPARRHVDAAYAAVAHADPINQILAVYAGSWLAEDLLMKADKMTMAHGLELRVPFLDYRLVEFLFSLPGESKVDGPATTGTKRMLRRAMRGKLPRSVLTRDKRGFPVPLAEWVRTQPRWFEEVLGTRAGIGGLVDREAVTALLKRSRAGEHLWQPIWNLTALWMWDAAMRAALPSPAVRAEAEAA